MSGASQSRLFVALWPDAQVRRQLAAWRDIWEWPRGATPVGDERLHMTLHFLGSVDHARIDPLRAALAVPFRPFELEFGEPVLWPHGIAVLEPKAVPGQLVQLHADLASALRGLALPVEDRAFKPHVTMARRALRASVPAGGPALTWAVEGYALMESCAGRYGVLQQYR